MTDEPATTPGADPEYLSRDWYVKRCGQLREQRDEARAELDETRRERNYASEEYARTKAERDAARAQAVQATTDADDLRARLLAKADEWERACQNDENGTLGYHATEYGDLYAADLRAVLDNTTKEA